MQWTQSMSVGNYEIDFQHKNLISYLDKLEQNIKRNNHSNDDLHLLLNEITEYTHTHLDYEEELLRRVSYADLETHCKLHNEFSNKIADLCFSAINNEQNFTEVFNYISSWIINHICIDDMKYKDAILKL